jgi:hypothetical protein
LGANARCLLAPIGTSVADSVTVGSRSHRQGDGTTSEPRADRSRERIPMDFLKTALAHLPATATSPMALLAYLVTIIAWAIIMWRVARNRELLRNLQKLPAKDRLHALELEMGGGIRLKEGFTPEQFLVARTQRYLFLGIMTASGDVAKPAKRGRCKTGQRHGRDAIDLITPLRSRRASRVALWCASCAART